MPQVNMQMLSNVLASAFTGMVTAWLSYLAAWSHFSTADNTALATIIAAALAIAACQIITVIINRYSVLINQMAQNGTKVVVEDQKVADSIQNPDVMGPKDAKVVTQ